MRTGGSALPVSIKNSTLSYALVLLETTKCDDETHTGGNPPLFPFIERSPVTFPFQGTSYHPHVA